MNASKALPKRCAGVSGGVCLPPSMLFSALLSARRCRLFRGADNALYLAQLSTLAIEKPFTNPESKVTST